MDLFKTFGEMEKRKVKELIINIQYILKCKIGENNFFTIESLEYILKQNNIEFTEKKLHEAIYILLVDFGSIVRYDNWNSEPIFQVLDERHKDTNWQKNFYALSADDSSEEKEFLLIADTHIGNDKIHNFKLINDIYDYTLKKGIKNIFHLGDIFDGINCNDSEKDKRLKLEKQLELFMKYYPNLEPSEVRTIALLGNHDKTIYGTNGIEDPFINIDDMKPQLYDLKSITKDNPGFMIYARKMFSLELNDISMHFSHRLYVDKLNRIINLNNLDDIDKVTKNMTHVHSLYFSGHIHKAFLHFVKDILSNNQLFIGVPSTSLLNKDNVVAYMVKINNYRLCKYIEITEIYCNLQNKIYTGKTYSYKVPENNRSLIKSLNQK